MRVKKEWRLCLHIGLILIGLSALIFASANLLGIELPDAVRGILGVIDLLAIPVVVYGTFKIAANKAN